MRRDKTNFKSKLIIKFFVETAAFTVLCIPVLLILNSYYQDYYDKLEEFDKSTAEHVSSYNVLWFIVFYFTMLLVIAAVNICKAGSYIDKSYRTINNFTLEEREKISYPKIMDSFKLKALEVENELLFKERAAREAEEKKNDLVVYLAHDLKTPLTSIIGYLTLLDETPNLPVEYKARYTHITLDKAYRLEQLINELFDITRFNLQAVALEHNRINLSLLLQQIVEEFYPSFKQKNITVEAQIDSKIMLVGDADKLARVFDNLIRNAVSYSYDNTVLKIFANADEKYAHICVRNIGDQIPEEKLQIIFEKFFRADNSRGTQSGGAGLGLAIAREIVELQNGVIKAFSYKDYTDFLVTLPLNV